MSEISRCCVGDIEFNNAVITMQVVVEVPVLDNDPAPPWPVAQIAPWSWLSLNADCTDEELGLFVAALAARIEVLPPSGRDEVVDALLAEELLTPESVTMLLARMLSPEPGAKILEPCAGTGTMLLGAARSMREAGHDPTTCEWWANDVDPPPQPLPPTLLTWPDRHHGTAEPIPVRPRPRYRLVRPGRGAACSDVVAGGGLPCRSCCCC